MKFGKNIINVGKISTSICEKIVVFVWSVFLLFIKTWCSSKSIQLIQLFNIYWKNIEKIEHLNFTKIIMKSANATGRTNNILCFWNWLYTIITCSDVTFAIGIYDATAIWNYAEMVEINQK